MKIARLNEILAELPGEVDLSKNDTLTAKMRYGLAQAYAIDGFREYMDLAIRTTNNAYDNVDTIEGHLYIKSKKVTLKALQTVAKNCFLDTQKLEKKERGLQD